MEKLDIDEDAFWRPVNVINPITKEVCKIILDMDILSVGSQIDGYSSNEYFTTYVSNG